MPRVLLLAVLALAAVLAPRPADAGRLTPTYTAPIYGGAPVYSAPVWTPYGWIVPGAPVYVPPPAYFGTFYDLDHRDIRYNRYFQRAEPPPQIRGYTLPR